MTRREKTTFVLPGPWPHSWSVRIIRKKGDLLGFVEAPDRQAAEAAAVLRYGLTDEQRRRLVITERRYRSYRQRCERSSG